jgi:ATP-dependent HslUV protease ATP-binding subunit HslU
LLLRSTNAPKTLAHDVYTPCLERLLEDISYNAGDLGLERQGDVLILTSEDVNKHLGSLVKDEDLSRFIL